MASLEQRGNRFRINFRLGGAKNFVSVKAAKSAWLYPFLVTAAYTGARRAELFRSRVEDFDFL